MRLLSSTLVLTLLLSGCTLWKQQKKPSWNGATGAEQYERLLWKAIQEKKWGEVEAHLAPMFVAVQPDGRKFDRAGWIEYWKAQPVGEFSLGDLTLQPSGADMVVVYEIRLQSAGAPAAAKGIRIISVWQQLKQGWVLTARSATVIQ